MLFENEVKNISFCLMVQLKEDEAYHVKSLQVSSNKGLSNLYAHGPMRFYNGTMPYLLAMCIQFQKRM